MKLSTFIRKNKIRLDSEMVGENPNIADQSWQANHYKVTLFHGRRQYTTYYSMGMAHSKEPEAQDVLDCLASDCSSVENASGFEDWARDLGYDIDSRRAEKTYKICQLQSQKLKRLLGDDLYDKLLYHTERL